MLNRIKLLSATSVVFCTLLTATAHADEKKEHEADKRAQAATHYQEDARLYKLEH